MGFKPKSKIYRLKFEDAAMEGLVVEVRPSSVGVLLDTADLASLASTFKGLSVNRIDSEDFEKIRKLRDLFDSFADSLISWNVEYEDDTPVPATREGVYSQDIDFILEVIGAWAEAVGGVSGPLEKGLNDTPQSQVAYLPMERLTASQ